MGEDRPGAQPGEPLHSKLESGWRATRRWRPSSQPSAAQPGERPRGGRQRGLPLESVSGLGAGQESRSSATPALAHLPWRQPPALPQRTDRGVVPFCCPSGGVQDKCPHTHTPRWRGPFPDRRPGLARLLFGGLVALEEGTEPALCCVPQCSWPWASGQRPSSSRRPTTTPQPCLGMPRVPAWDRAGTRARPAQARRTAGPLLPPPPPPPAWPFPLVPGGRPHCSRVFVLLLTCLPGHVSFLGANRLLGWGLRGVCVCASACK